MARVRVGACVVLAVTLAWNAVLGFSTTPSGPREDHFAIGRHLYETGTLVDGADPGVLKPPGYPVFVAAVLQTRDAMARVAGAGPESGWTDERALLLAQCLAWAVAAAAIFAVLAQLLPPFPAGSLALAFGCGPFGIALVGALSYPLLHVLGTTVSTAVLIWALRRPESRALAVLAGILWGLTTLVRPVSLIIPPFVIVLARLRKPSTWRSATILTAIFCAGLILAILPYAVRNVRRTGYSSLVNMQGGSNLWAPTVQRLGDDQECLYWHGLWRKHGMRVYREVTGASEHRLEIMRSHTAELDRAFTRKALSNIRERPGVYLYNVRRQLTYFALDPFVAWPDRFAKQNSMAKPERQLAERWVRAFSFGLMLLALPGIAVGLWRRDVVAWTAFLTLLMLTAGHAATLVQPSYTYPKLPLLVLACGVTLQYLGRVGSTAPGRAIGAYLRSALALAIGAIALVATAALVVLANP